MACRYTKLSNLLNIMVQRSDFFKSYHFGWGADIDMNILNNFNESGITGDLYPRVHMLVFEDGILKIADNKAEEKIRVDLWFLSLNNRDNCGKPLNLTLIEQVDVLSIEAITFVNKLDALSKKYCMGYVLKDSIKTMIDDKRAKDDLILYQLSFDYLLQDDICYDVDTSDFDNLDDIPCDDLENNCPNV